MDTVDITVLVLVRTAFSGVVLAGEVIGLIYHFRYEYQQLFITKNVSVILLYGRNCSKF